MNLLVNHSCNHGLSFLMKVQVTSKLLFNLVDSHILVDRHDKLFGLLEWTQRNVLKVDRHVFVIWNRDTYHTKRVESNRDFWAVCALDSWLELAIESINENTFLSRLETLPMFKSYLFIRSVSAVFVFYIRFLLYIV